MRVVAAVVVVVLAVLPYICRLRQGGVDGRLRNIWGR